MNTQIVENAKELIYLDKRSNECNERINTLVNNIPEIKDDKVLQHTLQEIETIKEAVDSYVHRSVNLSYSLDIDYDYEWDYKKGCRTDKTDLSSIVSIVEDAKKDEV